MKIKIFLFLIFVFFSCVSYAHQSSHAQISLQKSENTLSGVWHIAVDDLERSEGLDVNGDGELTWGELKKNNALIDSLAQAHFRISQDQGECPLTTGEIKLEQLNSGLYVYLPVLLECPHKINTLIIYYDFLFSFDAQHKAILNIQFDELVQGVVFTHNKTVFEYKSLTENKLQTLFDFIMEGAWHIWIGIDHILFLLSLLLPAALVLRSGEWQENRQLKQTLMNTAKIVTAFTLAHSITLALSVFAWVAISSRIVESVIAASVIVAALNNIRPVVHQRLWLLTFCFGLIHGLGFASVLSDVGLPPGLEGLALFGFNVGVELGQLAIVIAVLPLIYILSYKCLYRRLIMPLSSLFIAAIALLWFIERAVEIELLSWI